VSARIEWLTNDPEAARRLKAIERKYRKAISRVGCGLTIEERADIIRKARADRQAAFAAFAAERAQ